MVASENLENKNLNKPDPLEIKTFDLPILTRTWM